MSGYPHQPPSYGYGAPQQPYGASPSPPQPYGAAPPYGAQPPTQPYGGPSAPYGAPYAHPPGDKPPKDKPHSSAPGSYPPSAAYGSPFASLMPSAFPPGTDPNVVACFQLADQDGSGFIDDKELQRALSTYNQSFSLRTVHLLMYHFTNTNTRKIGKISNFFPFHFQFPFPFHFGARNLA
ncbi:probable calcium-binding protein CML49 [Jatropha curcas]|uniref:probable calcium-binding protein CML49 n=1 Tax=Jatropha curcas TaxID=180498 RepID=UPI001892D2AC|nr:probable calcium-binding protein CML49 [Jatropha curcas]